MKEYPNDLRWNTFKNMKLVGYYIWQMYGIEPTAEIIAKALNEIPNTPGAIEQMEAMIDPDKKEQFYKEIEELYYGTENEEK